MLPGKLGLLAIVSGFVLFAAPGCSERGDLIRMTKNRDALQVERDRLRRELDDRNVRIARLDQRVEALVQLGPDRPADLFAPVKIEIVGRSGGVDLDGCPPQHQGKLIGPSQGGHLIRGEQDEKRTG